MNRRLKLGSFFSALLLKRWIYPALDVRPVVAELFLTDNCNLRCISCACWRSNTPDELNRDEWFNVIDQLAEHDFVKLNFTGGEPLLRPDLLEILSYASKHSDAELHLNTNAILLSPNLAQQIIDAGVRSFNISVDGATPEVHDGIRGQKGAFETTLKHFAELMRLRDRYHLKLRLMFTVMRKNIDQLVEIAQLAQQLRAPKLYFNVVTDHTFLFRGYNIVRLGTVEDRHLEDGLNRLLDWKREHPEFIPRYRSSATLATTFAISCSPAYPAPKQPSNS